MVVNNFSNMITSLSNSELKQVVTKNPSYCDEGHANAVIFFVVRYDTLNFGVVRYGIRSATLRFISRATATEKLFRNVT